MDALILSSRLVRGLQLTHDAIIVRDLEGAILDRDLRFVDANSTASGLTGFSLDELFTRNVLNLFSQDERGGNPLRLDEVLEGKTVVEETRITRRDGSQRDVEISA